MKTNFEDWVDARASLIESRFAADSLRFHRHEVEAKTATQPEDIDGLITQLKVIRDAFPSMTDKVDFEPALIALADLKTEMLVEIDAIYQARCPKAVQS